MNNPTRGFRKPCPNEVNRYLEIWNGLDNYVAQENSLQKLFLKTYKRNSNLDDILVKVCTLNDFYSTNIYSPYKVARHILALSIDDRLSQGDPLVVNEIAKIKMAKGKKWNFYSFATKYCSHHHPTIYPIYDYYVDKVLIALKKKDRFTMFTHADLLDYPSYIGILDCFRKYYGLEAFNAKQVDKYLWQVGKLHFPRIKSNQNKKPY